MAVISSLKAHARHLSAAAMVGGFVLDNFAFGRIDHPATQFVLAGYILIAIFSIALLHYFEERAEQRGTTFRWAAILSATTQFAFGGLWSAFLIFYSRSAVIATSWPFLLILVAVFLGNEVFRQYRSRLVFTAILLFFALFSYATFVVPIFAGRIDRTIFLISGGLSVAGFSLFLVLLALLARSRIRRDLSKIAAGAAIIFVSLNLMYYMNVLPPLPLTLMDSGIFYSRGEVLKKYDVNAVPEPWYKNFGRPIRYTVAAGEPLYAYSAVFAPIRLTTRIVHEWEWYDDAAAKWVTQTRIAFPITGGRDSGYRGYSYKTHLRPGAWRVDIETGEGRAMGRINFIVQIGQGKPVPGT